MVSRLFYMLLGFVCQYFVEDSCICIHMGYLLCVHHHSEHKFAHLLGGWRGLGEAPGVQGHMRSAMAVGCEPVRDKSD